MATMKRKRRSTSIDAYVGSRIRYARLMRGWTQTDLGERLKISYQQIQKYESGANRIGSSRLWDISVILDTPIEFFFEGLKGDTAPGSRVRETVDRPMTRRTIQLAEAINRLRDENAKIHFLRLIQAYSKAL